MKSKRCMPDCGAVVCHKYGYGGAKTEIVAMFMWVRDATAWINFKVNETDRDHASLSKARREEIKAEMRTHYWIEDASTRRKIKGVTAHGHAILDTLRAKGRV